MPTISTRPTPHPAGEPVPSSVSADLIHIVDTPGGRCRVSFDDELCASPSGVLVGFAQLLLASGRWERLCSTAPFAYASNNAPQVCDVLGTLLLGALGGASRFAHLASLRRDSLARELFGMSATPSEDSVRRSLKRLDPREADAWLSKELAATAAPFLKAGPWVLDIDVTVKPLYGRQQEGAVVSYNPAKPGRPSRVHHTFLMAGTRLVLDTDIRAGDEHASRHGLDRIESLLKDMPPESRPRLVRGDCAYGTQDWMHRMDALGQPYLFKVSLSKNVLKLARAEPGPSEPPWRCAGRGGWQCRETTLKCDSWESPRRVVVMRRIRTDEQLNAARKKRRALKKTVKADLPLLAYAGVTEAFVDGEDELRHEHAVLASNTGYAPEILFSLYRDRADAENPFDELKNQWGWCGFSVRDINASASAARLTAIFYNWWNLYARLTLPGKHREAITSRPLLLGGVARKTEHSGQRHISVKLLHAACEKTKAGVVAAFILLTSMMAQATAPQSDPEARWDRLGTHIAAKIIAERAAKDTPLPPPTSLLPDTA